MKKTILKVSLGFLILVIGVLVVLGGYAWFSAKQVRVAAGVARPHFPYGDYNAGELNTMYPQYANENVATTQTPEQTHAKFISALKAGDLNGAVECCFRQGDWENMKAGLVEVQKKGQMGVMVGDLSGEIKIGEGQHLDNSSMATYYYFALKNGQKIGSTIDFIKDNRGVWLIKSL